jgi:hypothetical protein
MSSGRRSWIAVVVVAAAGAGVVAHGQVADASRVSGPIPARAAQTAATTPAKLACAALVQDGFTSNTTVPDFEEIPEAATRIQSATVVPATATAPEYCDVKGYIQSQVKFQLKLPTTTWQGRYLQMGCGGFCGAISATDFPACRAALGGDFAIAATNDGHDAAQTDAVWAGSDEQQRIDFGYRAVHVLAIAAKAIQTAYYGVVPRRAYFVGCSDGGREGLMEAQRYPQDFDGIVAGAPANNMSTDALFLAWGVKANTGPGGAPILTADKLAPLHAAVVDACDANDGVTGDGLIGDPRDCRFDPASIRCQGAEAPDCLTSAQVAVVRTLYAGIFDRQGRRLDPRTSPRGSELSWAGWWVPLPAPATAPAGTAPTFVARAFGENVSRWLSYPIGRGKPLDQVDLSVREFRQAVGSTRYYDALNPNLDVFRRRGGKLLMYQGWSDPLVPPVQTLEFYNALRATMGGQERTDRFARLFMVNGMGHCGGGPAPSSSDLTLQIVRWVEAGTAPDSVLVGDTDAATNQPRQRPVFPYPLVPKYVGPAGDPAAADKPQNFVAAPPATKHDDDVDWIGDFLLRPGPPGWTPL